MRKLEFVKMHGCGNDYIYVVADRVRPTDPGALARRLSDRRFGIGGDGLIMLCPSDRADVRMEMYNADGSRGEMCGNGIRCVARLHYEITGGRANPLTVETDCGVKTIALRLACGTGACAAVVAAVLTGRADRAATVELRGGNLEIEWRERGPGANHVFMTGEAVAVFRGEIELGGAEIVAAGGRS